MLKNKLTYKGIIKGLSIPMLPHKINNVYNNIYVRILRFIGGLSLVLVITAKYLLFFNFFHLPILILATIQIILMIIFSIIKTVYGIYLLKFKPEQFEVINSPLSKYATIYLKSFIVLK